MAKKPLSSSVKLFPEEVTSEPIVYRGPISRLEQKRRVLIKEEESVIAQLVAEKPVSVKINTKEATSTEKKEPKKTKQKPDEKEHITAEDGLSRIELFSSNINTLQRYHTTYETDMVARRVRNMLVLFIEFSNRIIDGATFEDETQKAVLSEKIAVARPLIKKWDNLPDIADMVMNKVKKESKDKR